MANLKISKVGLDLIKSFEGCQLKAYKPVPTEQWWTIGWGHYGPDVKQGMTITQAQADQMFIDDMPKYEAPVNKLFANNPINQNQFDALVSFCYNCGSGNLNKLCLGRTIPQIADNIIKYDKSSGKVLAGLVRRRKAEQALFNNPVTVDKAQATQATVVDVYVNGVNVGKGDIVNGVTRAPVRAVAQALGANVIHNAENKRVDIYSLSQS